jgi:pyruvate formate lyase activating enzyme
MFHKVTYNRTYDFATVHNYGCTFRCPICSYKLKSGPNGTPGLAYPRPEKYLSAEEIKKALLSVNPSSVHFMGGEPTVSKMLPEILEFVKKDMGAETMLGHTNGINLSIPNLDGANVGLKAWYEDVHLEVTGIEKSKIYGEFSAAAKRGMKVSANIIYIPGLVDKDQVEAVAEYISQFNVPFHIMGYIPVPGQPYRRPTLDEMKEIQRICSEHIPDIRYSYLSPEDVLSLERNDDRFDVTVIAGSKNTRTLVPTFGTATVL